MICALLRMRRRSRRWCVRTIRGLPPVLQARSALRVVTRGCAVPPPDRRPIVRPHGDRNWLFVRPGEHKRQVNHVIGVLLKKHFPGLVKVRGNVSPGFTWAHYQAAHDEDFGNKAERIQRELWEYFTCDDGFQGAARVSVERVAKNRLPDMLHDVRFKAVIRYHGLDEEGKPMTKKVACETNLDRDQYLSERQYPGGQVHELQAWAHGHRGTGLGQAYCSDKAKESMDAYTAAFREEHGPEADPLQHPLDPVAVMKAGEGKKNGHHYLCDGAISTSSTPKLSQLRAQSTSSSASIRSRPKASAFVIAELQAELEEERNARAAELEEERAARAAGLQEERRLRQEAEAAQAAELQQERAAREKLQSQLQVLSDRVAAMAPPPPPQP